MLDILADLVAHVQENQIPLPIILFIDGYSGHLGPDIFEYCRKNQIRLWLFKPNMTHLLQPLVSAFRDKTGYKVSQKMSICHKCVKAFFWTPCYK